MSDIVGEVTSAPETFTSWDKCMEKSYCKWPAIIAIVVGSLIALSLLWCVVRCICCGVRICTCCCGGCGGSGRGRKSKHQDDYNRMPPTPYGGYQPTPGPMAYGYPQPGPQPGPQLGPQRAVPQFATFEEPSRKVQEDSLPAMPTWDSATKRRVEDTSEPPQPQYDNDVEMGRLDPQPQRMRGGYNSVPVGPVSPITPQPQTEYFQGYNQSFHQPHHADMGTQRMEPYGNEYDSFQAVPLSPPPTYRSNSVAPSFPTEKFSPGVANPGPVEYSQTASPYHNQPPSSYAPSSISTRYEPPQHDYTPYQSQPQQQEHYQPRPPSFLQPGRRPVNGSFREV